MELLKIRGGRIEDFKDKKYNIGIGISLGNKWFTVENVVKLVQWILPYTRDSLTIFVADTIHAINLEVQEGLPKVEALLKAKEMGVDFLKKIKEEIKSKNIDDENIYYAVWDDIKNNNAYKQKLNYLYNLYENNITFKHRIHDIVSYFIVKHSRQYSKDEVNYLGTYILEELPELLNRLQVNGITLDAYAYPHDGEVGRLVDRIQQGKEFSEIRENILTTTPKVFLEVR